MQTRIAEYGSEFDWNANLPFYTNKSNDELLDNAVYYRSGRDALKEVARHNAKIYHKVLLPAMCCEAMLSPFIMNGYKVIFYKLNPDFSADLNDIYTKASNNSIILYINYFGVAAILDVDLRALKNKYPRIILLEDRTHDIIARRKDQKFTPDYTIASVRKWIAIPDGGILQTHMEVDTAEPESKFSGLRISALKLKSQYLNSGNQKLKDEFRKKLDESGDVLNKDAAPYGMTDESRKMLSELDFDSIYQQRSANVAILKTYLQPLVDAGRIRFITERPEISNLYFPILLENRDNVQEKAAQKNVYCPVIWPVPEDAIGICKVSGYVGDHMLAIPCDQRYNVKDMKTIADVMISVIG